MSDSRLAPRSTVAELFRDHHGELVRLAVLMLIRDIVLGADPGGQHLLLSYAGQDGFRTGWIGQGKFHPLLVPQPYHVVAITAW